MENQFVKMQNINAIVQTHGPKLIIGLVILILGILLTKWIVKFLKNMLGKFIEKDSTVSIICNSTGIILLAFVITASGVEIGAKPGPMISFLMIVCLVAIGIIIIFRPLMPTLPFKVGNTVKAGNILGRIESTTILNTQLKTFDGKTFFVPNRQILNEVVINYHFTETRRVKINVCIRYDQDLMKAKQVFEALMTEDSRVLRKPPPVVFVLNLSPMGVELGGRCWVKNRSFWVTKCELLEKTKFRFDSAGILFAYPQLDIHHYNNGSLPQMTSNDVYHPHSDAKAVEE
ncbi:MAG: mechanosensitive ion channel family protein [Deltaproteobacteria bacterium]|jgi:small conductance mechanosensitive channel|nr:mechanosensitive ion channel family protein [Deltaproteobacteria bacterium]MBT4641112.1 mechanosensitive ion channel family protein [Deltaproteobacteria bacterium]MBT6505006.1 mechanosensitive ion channel family protein [Deltaproteobacteria bacterium]MBT6615526.1 mechanosensitive ion channel family protein [Deltaproteobacteria bacterium]MBT7155098.1 mechanosensitive ion channel family protein [Deltaproteobacteria bacterium]